MIGTLLLFAIGIAASTFLIKAMADWWERRFIRAIENTLDDAGYIANEEKLPEAWLQPFRERIDAMQRKGKSEDTMRRVGRRARQRCLLKLDNLIKFFQKRAVTDSEQTRQLMLTSLQQQRDWVVNATWQELLAPETDLPDTTESATPSSC
jgi:hypothetical protein